MKTMNENNEGPQPWNDPALEARIVAGVLGEASAFEAAELERILAENPELAIFKRRIEAVHALVGAATRPEQPKIQLSPTRRQMLLEKLGAGREAAKKKIFPLPFPKWWSPHVLNRLVACLVIMAFVAVLFSLSIPAVTGSLHKAARRSGLASAGVADPGYRGEAYGFVSGPPSSTSGAVERRVMVQDGQTTVEGVLKSDAPDSGKAMDFAMKEADSANMDGSRVVAEAPAASNEKQLAQAQESLQEARAAAAPAARMNSYYADGTTLNGGELVMEDKAGAVSNGRATATVPQPQKLAEARKELQDARDSLQQAAPQMMAKAQQKLSEARPMLKQAAQQLASADAAQELEKADEPAQAMAMLSAAEPAQALDMAQAAEPAYAAVARAEATESLGVQDSLKASNSESTAIAGTGGAAAASGIARLEKRSDRAEVRNAAPGISDQRVAGEVMKREAHAEVAARLASPDDETGGPVDQMASLGSTNVRNGGATAVSSLDKVGPDSAAPSSKPTRAPLPAGTEENRDSSGKFDGFINYGSPIAPTAAPAIIEGAVDALAFSDATEAPKASSTPQSGDRLAAGQASAITQFSHAWGRGSGSGAGNGAREELSKDGDRDLGMQVASSSITPSAAPAPMEHAKAKSSVGEDKQRVLNESTDLVSDLEVTARSGQRATNGILSDDLDSARNKGDKPTGQTLAGANTYSGGTTVTGGTLALARGGKLDADKKAADKKSPAAPVPGDIPLAGRAFSSKPGKDRASAFQTETPTAKQPFSTFSLHVSDVSFQLAKDALARGARPDPDRIRAEEFYNAFDYGDPAPAPGEEVACRIEQCAHPFLQQRDLVRIALKVAAAGRAAGQPLRLTILLDTSGSMEREDRAASVRRALGTLASLLGPNDRVTLIGFARTPRLLAEQVPGDQAKKLVEIAARTPSEGGTNLELALGLASELALKQKLPAAQNRIVLLTDGAANLGDANPARLARQIEKTRQQGISFDACGVGANGLNDEILEALTRKGDGRYYFINKPEDADAGFARQLAGALRPAAENVKVQVAFNPARVSQYRLIGFEKHLLKKEDFRNDKVQAAELSAEEAGVAVYQVQTLPEGEGELGEVFVRFRDPANGQMVEHSWTMPYDAKAPAFDKAAPSMQLAVTSALLAEKLRGDSQMDLNALAPVITNLRGQYPHQAKVADLIRMFERMRQ